MSTQPAGDFPPPVLRRPPSGGPRQSRCRRRRLVPDMSRYSVRGWAWACRRCPESRLRLLHPSRCQPTPAGKIWRRQQSRIGSARPRSFRFLLPARTRNQTYRVRLALLPGTRWCLFLLAARTRRSHSCRGRRPGNRRAWAICPRGRRPRQWSRNSSRHSRRARSAQGSRRPSLLRLRLRLCSRTGSLGLLTRGRLRHPARRTRWRPLCRSRRPCRCRRVRRCFRRRTVLSSATPGRAWAKKGRPTARTGRSSSSQRATKGGTRVGFVPSRPSRTKTSTGGASPAHPSRMRGVRDSSVSWPSWWASGSRSSPSRFFGGISGRAAMPMSRPPCSLRWASSSPPQPHARLRLSPSRSASLHSPR
jgi:hypothetical protein